MSDRCNLDGLFGGLCGLDMVTQSEALKLTEQAVAVACAKFGDESQVNCGNSAYCSHVGLGLGSASVSGSGSNLHLLCQKHV